MKRTDAFTVYSGETTEELLAYPARGQREAIVRAFEEGIQRKAARKGDGALTEEERIVLGVRSLEREINNGGFDQFFRNSSRKFAPILVDSLVRIGCKREAEITRRAINALHLSTLDSKPVLLAMSSDDEKRDLELDECDQMYYRIQSSMARRLYSFIRSNKSHIKL
jgi:hypothetical protein